MPTEPKILIVDLRSQLTLLIARLLRENGYRSVVLSPAKATTWLQHNKPKSIILSGSDKGVHDTDAPQPPDGILDLEVPILGICYGMQWLATRFGGRVDHVLDHVDYGPASIEIFADDPLFDGLEAKQQVWASHGDSVVDVGDNFCQLATSSNHHGISAMRVEGRLIWGVQFHPEVHQTTGGGQMLVNFVRDICGCSQDWEPEDIVASVRDEVARHSDMRAILGFSGGVDSTVTAAILAPVMGDRLLGVCIDAGHLRQDELKEIERHAEAAGITLKVIDAAAEFERLLAGETDAEKKRAIFGDRYEKLLMAEAVAHRATHMAQGTLAPDKIESAATGGDLIKSHHNVGRSWGDLGALEPLSPFFKYEVRALAKELGLPDSVVHRTPFPGPGLFLRVFGGEVTTERLDIVRWADHEVGKILAKADDVPEISQLVVALNCTSTTGVKGDKRAYGPAVVIRGVQTSDFMTANPVEFPVEIRRAVTARLTQHPGIVRVWWDENPKPPATTEFE